MPRLPNVGADVNTWGGILNTFLGVGHNAAGTLSGAIGVVNVKDDTYGAKGDNVTDDTSAFTAAINAVNTAGGGWLFVPAGNYKITTTLPVITAPIHLVGAGAGIQFTGVTQLSFAAGIPGIQLGDSGGSVNSSPSVIEGLVLVSADSSNGQGSINGDHGIGLATSSSHSHGTIVRNVVIQGFGGNGVNWSVSSGNGIGAKFENVRVHFCNGHGFNLAGQNVSVSTFDNCDIDSCGLYAFFVNAPGCVFLNCQTAFCSQQAGRTVSDAVTNGTTTLTSATANFTSADLGQVVTGTNLASNTSILTVNSSSNVTLNQVATGSGSGGTLTILNGGAVYDETEGSCYLNFYAESGLGSNLNFTNSSSGSTFIGGNWTGGWFSSGNLGGGSGYPIIGWNLLNRGGSIPEFSQPPEPYHNWTIHNGYGTSPDNIQFQANAGPNLIIQSVAGFFPVLTLSNANGTTGTLQAHNNAGFGPEDMIALCGGSSGVFGVTKTGLVHANTPIGLSTSQATLSGTTAGTAVSSMPFIGISYKKVIVFLNGYENTTASAQTITYSAITGGVAFTNSPKIVADDSGGASTSATVLTLPANMGATKTGWIIVEGY